MAMEQNDMATSTIRLMKDLGTSGQALPTPGHQRNITGGRTEQPVALAEEERPHLVSQIADQTDAEGGGSGMPECTTEPTGDVVGSISETSMKVGAHLITPMTCQRASLNIGGAQVSAESSHQHREQVDIWHFGLLTSCPVYLETLVPQLVHVAINWP